MKKFLLFAAAAALFAACASDELQTQTQQQTAQDDGAINFDAYMQRNVTRAGIPGGLTLNTDATTKLTDTGFGVFAYYTDNFDYTPLYLPNFMYNEEVTWDTDHFKYGVTKYWPNEHGSAAVSADQDRVSFFAYAPYVDVDPSTGMLKEGSVLLEASDPKLQYGITGMKRNTLQGDPIIQYISSFDQSKCVDLCWGTTGSTAVTWGTNGSSQTIAAGYPWLNVRKPNGVVSDDSKVKFNFQHALAKLAVTVKTDFTGDWTVTKADQTKVWVRSIRFTGIAHKAALNLNNPKTMDGNKARWIDYYGTNELELGESVTVYDGRKNGSEGVLDAIAPNEAVLGLNPAIVQVEDQIEYDDVNKIYKWKTSGTGVQTGVTNSGVSVFTNNGAPADYVYVIPTGEKVTVEIVYDIETIDAKLPTQLSDGETNGSTVENRISKAITFGTGTNKLENGKSYTLNLILGLKDVQFTATVNEDWGSADAGNAWLPNNLFSVAAGATTTITVPWNATSIEDFMVTGLVNGKAIAATYSDDVTAAATDVATVPISGEVKVTGIAMTSDNDGVGIKEDAGQIIVTMTDTPSDVVTTIHVNRAGKPFVFADINLTAGDNQSFNILAGSGSGTVIEDQWTAALSSVVVEKKASGASSWTSLSPNDDSADAQPSTFQKSATTDRITISDLDGLVAGDKIRVTIKVGDVPSVSKVIDVVAP